MVGELVRGSVLVSIREGRGPFCMRNEEGWRIEMMMNRDYRLASMAVLIKDLGAPDRHISSSLLLSINDL